MNKILMSIFVFNCAFAQNIVILNDGGISGNKYTNPNFKVTNDRAAIRKCILEGRNQVNGKRDPVKTKECIKSYKDEIEKEKNLKNGVVTTDK